MFYSIESLDLMESLLTSLTPPMLELLFISYAIFINNVLTLQTLSAWIPLSNAAAQGIG